MNKVKQFVTEARIWFLRDALERNNWHVQEAAREIGMNRTSLHRAIEVYGLADEEPEPEKPKPEKPKPRGRLMTPEFRRFLGQHGSDANVTG